jgi:ketopantoate reductase
LDGGGSADLIHGRADHAPGDPAACAAQCRCHTFKSLAVHPFEFRFLAAAGSRRVRSGLAKVGEHRTSMLQDAEAGRPTELDALLGSVIELGRIVGVVTPTLDVVYALTSAR